MNRYVTDTISNGTIEYIIIRDTSNNTFAELPIKYLKYKKNLGRTKKTLKSTARKLVWYLNYLDFYNLEVTDILKMRATEQQEHFSTYLRYVKSGRHTKTGKCPDNNSANEYLRSVFDYYDFLILELNNGQALKILRDTSFTYTSPVGLRFTRAARTFRGYLPKVEHREKAITEADIKTLISCAKTKRDKLLLLLLEESGFRIGEILGLRITTDIDFEKRKIYVTYRENNPNDASAKYAEERGALISSSTFDLLTLYISDTAELRKNTDYLFISEYGKTIGQPLSQSSVYSLLNRLAKHCNLHVHPHQLRKYFANERRKAGWDITKISTALGHKNIATTEIYLNVEDDELTTANEEYFEESMKFVNINDFL